MSLRNRILTLCYRLSGRSNIVHSVGFSLYGLLFRVMRFYFRAKFPAILQINQRHSSKQKEHFNLFFSDIDSTFIVSDEKKFSKIIQHFKKFRTIFPMFDMPEFYTKEEGVVLEKISSASYEPYIKVIWNIRKLNWIKKTKFNDQYEQLKQERAFKKSFDVVFQCNRRKNDSYYFNEINFFKDHLSQDSWPQVCSRSDYLDTTTPFCLRLLGTYDDFFKFNAMMAGEDPIGLNEAELKIKTSVEAREQLIAHTSIRIARALNQDLSTLENWNGFLDERNSMKHFMS